MFSKRGILWHSLQVCKPQAGAAPIPLPLSHAQQQVDTMVHSAANPLPSTITENLSG
jgi:hypothetical protein